MKHKITALLAAPGDFTWEGDQLFIYVDEDEVEEDNGDDLWSVFIDSDAMEHVRTSIPMNGCKSVVAVTKSGHLIVNDVITMAGGSCRMIMGALQQ